MSWNKTTVDGQTMYERSDGVRVSRTQDIDAINRQEQLEMESWRSNRQINAYYDEDMINQEDEKPSTSTVILVLILLIALLVNFFLNK